MNRHRDSCNHVAKRLDEEGVRLKAGSAAAASKVEDEVSDFLRGLVVSMKNCVGIHFAHARVSVSERSFMVVEILRGVGRELQDIVSGQSVNDDDHSDFGSVPPSREVLLLFWIDAAPDDVSLDIPSSDELPSASSPRSKKGSKTPPKRSTKRHKTFAM